MHSEPLPAAATPGYLTEALRRCGALGDGVVGAVAVDTDRDTIVSRILRLRLSYNVAANAAPRSLILKTSLPARAGYKWIAGRQEVAFYTNVAATTPRAPVPLCFDAHWNAETNDWHLLLEDLSESHVTLGNWPLPPSFEQSCTIVAAWARFHAGWWDDARLGVSVGDWIEYGEARAAALSDAVDRFAARLGDRLAPARLDTYHRLIDAAPRLYRRYTAHRHMTIVHGDAHVWNLFLPRAEGSDDIRFFDWDTWRLGIAASDLAYMMALHWFPEHRRRAEQRLLDHYHAVLLAQGVSGYDRRTLDEDYRFSVLWQLTTPVWQAFYDIPPWIWWNHLERIFAAIDDLGCRELLQA